MRLSPRSAILAFTALVAFACSGSTTSDLLTGTGAGTSSSGESSGTSSGNTSSSGDLSSSGNTSSSGNGSSSGTSGGSSGTVVDAGRPDVGIPDPDKNAVLCNKESATTNAYCTGNQVCCGKRNGGGPGVVAMACTQALSCADPTNQVPLSCDDRDDCPNGQVCCGYGYNNQTGQFIYTRSACALVCPDVTLCDPDLGGNQCPNGRSCQPSTLIPGYFACAN